MTMSWLADRKATTTAHSAIRPGSVRGSVRPSARIAAASSACSVSAQPRRRPKARVIHGSGRRSMNGDHTNLKL